jgi:hypothetical protein
LIDEPLEAARVTRKTPSTKFIPLYVALAHVAAHERAPKLALTRALAGGKVQARGFVQYAWPPYSEGEELLSPELFTNYPPQHPPARIDWVEGTAVMGDGHPHAACTVYGIEVNQADLLRLWPGVLKRPARRLSVRLVKQAEQAIGRRVTSVTLADGTKLDFTEQQGGGSDVVDQWIAKHAD